MIQSVSRLIYSTRETCSEESRIGCWLTVFVHGKMMMLLLLLLLPISTINNSRKRTRSRNFGEGIIRFDLFCSVHPFSSSNETIFIIIIIIWKCLCHKPLLLNVSPLLLLAIYLWTSLMMLTEIREFAYLSLGKDLRTFDGTHYQDYCSPPRMCQQRTLF